MGLLGKIGGWIQEIGKFFRTDPGRDLAGTPLPEDQPPWEPVDFGTPQAIEGEERDYGDGTLLYAFLNQYLVLMVQSSWLQYAKYFPRVEELEIGFRDGWVAVYGNVNQATAAAFAQAPSKGKFMHQTFKASYKEDGRHWNHSHPYRPGQGVVPAGQDSATPGRPWENQQ